MATKFKGLRETQPLIDGWSGTILPDTDLQRENLDLLEKRRQDVVSSSNDVRRAFLIFGAFSLYLIITVGSTTHLQLLTGTVFKLPILSVEIPILGFFVVLPLLYMLAHFNLMGELNALSEDVQRLKQHLKDTGLPLLEKIPFGPARLLIQPDDCSAPRALINIVTSLAIVVLPPLILLLVQIRFLPYHSEPATWLHRIIIFMDICLVFFLWYPLKFAYIEKLQHKEKVGGKSPPDKSTMARRVGLQWFGLGLSGFLVIMVLPVSLVLATVPDGWLEERQIETFDWFGFGLKQIGPVPSDAEKAVQPGVEDREAPDLTYHGITPAKRTMLNWTYDWFEAPASWHWMRRNLIVANKDLVAMRPSDEVLFLLEDEKLEDVEERKKDVWEQGARGVDLRGRNLRYAVFSHSDMHMADMRGADLEGAIFFKTKLRYADLGDIFHAEIGRCANEPFWSFLFDRLVVGPFRTIEKIEDNQVILCRTNLRHATLKNVEAQHARFWKSDLSNADMRWMDLARADLNHANLRQVNLAGSMFKKAKLNDANLRGATFAGAMLHDVLLNDWARFNDAKMAGAKLDGEKQLQRQLTECQLTWSKVPDKEDEKEEAKNIVKIETSLCHQRFLQ